MCRLFSFFNYKTSEKFLSWIAKGLRAGCAATNPNQAPVLTSLGGSNKQSRIFRLNDVIMAGNCEYKFELYKHSTVVNKDSQIF